MHAFSKMNGGTFKITLEFTLRIFLFVNVSNRIWMLDNPEKLIKDAYLYSQYYCSQGNSEKGSLTCLGTLLHQAKLHFIQKFSLWPQLFDKISRLQTS